jgi:hypothetical protein
VAQHVGVDRIIEPGTLADALNQPIDCIRREWAAALGLEHEAASHLHSAAGEILRYQDSELISRAKLFRG